MILQDARENYYTFSATLSSVNRQLCFAGIAVIWIFSVEHKNGVHSLDHDLFIPLGLFVLGLALDLLHYMVASALWSYCHRSKEKKGVKEDEEFKVSYLINWPSNIFFWGKSFSTIIGYSLLLNLIIDYLKFTS